MSPFLYKVMLWCMGLPFVDIYHLKAWVAFEGHSLYMKKIWSRALDRRYIVIIIQVRFRSLQAASHQKAYAGRQPFSPVPCDREPASSTRRTRLMTSPGPFSTQTGNSRKDSQLIQVQVQVQVQSRAPGSPPPSLAYGVFDWTGSLSATRRNAESVNGSARRKNQNQKTWFFFLI